MRPHFSVSLSFCLSLLACKTAHPSDSSLNASLMVSPPSPQEIYDHPAWMRYVDETSSKQELQPACQPASFRHQDTLKGMVILFHGFTACPQQYFDVADELSRQGWDVYLPTNPGHGLRRDGQVAEDQLLPTRDDYASQFGAFIKTINEVARTSEAPVKVVGGLSLGGALATAAFAEAPELYQRALIMTPFYAMRKPMSYFLGGLKNVDAISERLAPEALSQLAQSGSDRLLEKEVGWGPPCEEEANLGRQGICKFRVTHLVGSQQFGYEFSQKEEIKGRLQFVGVANDPAIDNDRLKWYVEKRVKRPDSQAELCFYPNGANHSLISTYDAPSQNKFWLSSFKQAFYAFVTKGTFFPTKKQKVEGYPQCEGPDKPEA